MGFHFRLADDKPESKPAAELFIYDSIGADFWDDGVTAKNVLEYLVDIRGQASELHIRINSPGGNVDDGVAIYNAIQREKIRTVVEVDGFALSAASIIAMAGDEIHMREGAMMMIHEAAAMTMGPAEDHERMARVLRKMNGAIAGIYASRTGIAVEAALELMAVETWMGPEDAVKAGFADKVITARPAANNDPPVDATAFKRAGRYVAKYMHAPRDLRVACGLRGHGTVAPTRSGDAVRPPTKVSRHQNTVATPLAQLAARRRVGTLMGDLC
jgi:ATP-dependent protease ClpP protease subunit